MNKVNVAEKLALVDDFWNPRIIGDLNDSHVKIVKLKGDFLWHHHDNEDELFLVIAGVLHMWIRDSSSASDTIPTTYKPASEREVVLHPGEFIIISRGTDHLPKADPQANNGECHILLLEPKTTLNTGNVRNERTVPNLERL